jgi:predicted chitinase
MRAREFITEVFDNPYPIQWDDSWVHRARYANTTTNAGNMRIAFISVPNDRDLSVVAIEFKVGDTFDLTGRGDQWRIFATVKSAIAEYLQKFNRPNAFLFSSKTDKRSRTYHRMVMQLAPRFGYRITATPPDLEHYGAGDQVFTLVDTQQKQDLDEVTIDNREGAGATGYNANVDYRGLRVMMRPSTFLRLAAPLGGAHSPDLEKYIAQGGAIGAPFLLVEIPDSWEQGDFDSPATVYGHEGRNRMSAVRKLEGDEPIEVHLIPAGENREYRNRHLTAQHIAALNRWMRREKSSSIESGPLFTVADSNELDEGWREKTAAAMAAATLGYGALTQQPADTATAPLAQPMQQTQTAPQSQDPIFQDQNPQRDYLVAQARAAGIRGAELSHFVAQAAHETGDWQHMVEQPPQGARNPQRYFARKYEGKRILGNVKRGDGYRFRGRGYIQLTGRDNYTRVGRALGIDLVNHPELAADPATAARIAVYFWKKRVAPRVADFERAGVRDVTRGINPAQRGLERRQAQFAKVAQR